MPNKTDRFLRQKTALSGKVALGRVFGVTRETWRLSDDPQVVPPQTETLSSRRTASDAADLARSAAAAHVQHGFHKPSGSWWGADDAQFHRFVIHAGRRHRTGALLLVSGFAGLAAVALLRGILPAPSPPGRKPPKG